MSLKVHQPEKELSKSTKKQFEYNTNKSLPKYKCKKKNYLITNVNNQPL